jgi:hypothetical protein
MFDQGYEIMNYLFVMMKFQNNDVKDQLNKLRVYNNLLKAVEMQSWMTRLFRLIPTPFVS